MTVINTVYYDENLLANLEILKQNIADDWDFWLVIDGLEGSGKSTLAQQIGYFFDPSLSVENIVFTPKQFEMAVERLDKEKVIIWDEAITGAQAIDMTKMARSLQKKAVQMRQKNLYVILVLHSYFEMKKYYAIHRTWFLLHTYTHSNKESRKLERGFFMFFDRDKKLGMYCNDAKRRSYIYSESPNFKGRFTKRYCVDEIAYKRKKSRIGEETEGLTDREWALECFKRKLTVNQIKDYVNMTERNLYLIKDTLNEEV